jgi:hypothetical protein
MKTKEKKSEKRIYIHPEIMSIELDNEISLALESPPVGPDEGIGQSLQNVQNNPFKENGCFV